MVDVSEKMTLEKLLRMTVPVPAGCIAPEGTPMTPEFRVSVQDVRDDGVHFIIHANGHDSTTLDLVAQGNRLRPYTAMHSAREVDGEFGERVARAIRKALEPVEISDNGCVAFPDVMKAARAAIAAMGEGDVR